MISKVEDKYHGTASKDEHEIIARNVTGLAFAGESQFTAAWVRINGLTTYMLRLAGTDTVCCLSLKYYPIVTSLPDDLIGSSISSCHGPISRFATPGANGT